MGWLPEKLTTAQKEERRLEAARLLKEGRWSQAEIARHLGVRESAASAWAKCLREGGVEALKARPHPGHPSKLTPAQWKELERLLDAGAVAAGFPTERWTLPRVAQLIRERFGVKYHPNDLGEPLRRRGFSPQRPKPKARERDDALIEAWLKRDWPRVERGLREQAE